MSSCEAELFASLLCRGKAGSQSAIETTFTDENGNRYITSQELNPNYPGDEVVKIAQMLYLSIPQGQAMEIGTNNIELLQQMPIYSIVLIGIVNIGGIYLFIKKNATH